MTSESHAAMAAEIAELKVKLAESDSRVGSMQQDYECQFERAEKAEASCAVLRRERGGEVWVWQDDEDDHPESLSCPVLIHHDTLQRILAERDDLKAKLAEAEKKTIGKRKLCDCGHLVELRSPCIVCGAPQCCPICCHETTLKMKLAAAEKERDDAQAFYEGQSDTSDDLQEALHKRTVERDKLAAECAVLREALHEACRSCAQLLGEDVVGNCPACEVQLSGALKVTAGTKAAEVLKAETTLEARLKAADRPVKFVRGGPWHFGDDTWELWRNGKALSGRITDLERSPWEVCDGHLVYYGTISDFDYALHELEVRAPRGYTGLCPDGMLEEE